MSKYSKHLGLQGNWICTEDSGESGQIIIASNITLIYGAVTSLKRSIQQIEKYGNLESVVLSGRTSYTACQK